jgi:hypothetical protein
MKERLNEKERLKELERQPIQSNYSPSTINSSLTINYVTDASELEKTNETPNFISNSTTIDRFEEVDNNVTLPIFFGECKILQIPKGIRRRIKRLPKGILKKIDFNKDMAVEKCFIMISNLTYTVFEDEDYWKGLSSKILNQQFKKGPDNTFVYKNIIEALKYETNSTYPIIDCKKNSNNTETYRENYYAKQYRLNSSSKNIALEPYQIKFEDNIIIRENHSLKQFNKANSNVIGQNLIKVYDQITLPPRDEILNHAKKLVKENYKNKKGKKLTFLNKKSKSYYSSPEQRSFVGDNIKLYEFLVGSNFMIPKIGDFKSGGRVVDSFNLMPSWIRSLVKINNEEIIELDFKALHPNIAFSIYGEPKHQITHEYVAKALSKPLYEIKIQHLSFFNKRVEDMKKSILYDFYYKREKVMLENIIREKKKYGYKKTSQQLFKKEVIIMSDIIYELSGLGIYVLYVYDALYCRQTHEKTVTKIMNRVIKKHNVFTNIG